MSTAMIRRGRVSTLIAAVMVFAGTGPTWGQDLKPSVRWNVDGSADWNDAANWNVNGTDPLENRIPGEDDVASLRNGGTTTIGSSVPTVGDVGILSGGIEIGDGGSLTINGAFASGADGSLSVSGSGAITAGTFSSAGDLAIGGANANISVQGNFESTGNLSLSTTGANPYSIINVAGSARLGGSIDLASTPAGATMTLGSSWPFLKASSVSGQPSQITVGGEHPSLDRGVGLQVAVAGDGTASVAVENVPIAIVNRETGSITVENPVGNPLDLKAYTLTSSNGLLNTTAWNSLADQQTPGWSESVSNANQLIELNLTDATSLTVGGTLDLGSGWGGLAAPPREEDLAFSYALADGRVLHGEVEYTGAINDLVLNINKETGEAILQNLSANLGDLDIVGYNILSDSGSLDFANFTGLGDAGFTPSRATENGLGEIAFSATKTFSPGTTISLGNIFSSGAAEDIKFEFGTPDLNLLSGTVIYSGGGSVGDPFDCNQDNTVNIDDTLCATESTIAGTLNAAGLIAGDLDGNGNVEFADFLTLSGKFGQAGNYKQGDINVDGTVNFADFLTLSGNFGKSSQAAASVPEPGTAGLTLLGLLALMGLRKRSSTICVLSVIAISFTVVATDAQAADLDSRFIRLHPDAPNTRANSNAEVMGILNGSIIDVIKNDDIVGTVDIVDFAGGLGSFDVDNAYPNGVNDDTMNDFIQYVSGTLTFPEGSFAIGLGRDDGGLINMPNISFIETFAERGDSVAGDGQIQWDGTGGHQWTIGLFEVPAGGITTPFEAFFWENGGGDSFEIAIGDVHPDPEFDDLSNNAGRTAFVTDTMFEFEDGALGISVTGDPFVGNDPADLNSDGIVNGDDFDILSGNMLGSGAGDLDNNGMVNLEDFIAFANAFPAPARAATIPEPTGLMMTVLAGLLLFHSQRKRLTKI